MTDKEYETVTGSCFCKTVKYEVKGPLRDVVNCHCNQCTKLNGNYGPHSKAHKVNITVTNKEKVTWFKISNNARRGFCSKCGSGLFWEQYQQDAIGIIAGSLDQPTRLKTIAHIFVKEKPDFYEIADDIQQFEFSSNGKIEGDYL